MLFSFFFLRNHLGMPRLAVVRWGAGWEGLTSHRFPSFPGMAQRWMGQSQLQGHEPSTPLLGGEQSPREESLWLLIATAKHSWQCDLGTIGRTHLGEQNVPKGAQSRWWESRHRWCLSRQENRWAVEEGHHLLPVAGARPWEGVWARLWLLWGS